MANLSITQSDVYVVENKQAITVKGGETVASRRAAYMRIDGTSGQAVLGNATTSGEVGNVRGLALTSEKYLGDTVSLLQHGILRLGDALSAINYGDPVYLSDTDGILDTAAGTVSTIVGYVWPIFETDGTVSKVLYVDLR